MAADDHAYMQLALDEVGGCAAAASIIGGGYLS